MPNLREIFPTRFISAADLAKLGENDRMFVIEKVVAETAHNPKTKKEDELYIVYFKGTKKGHRIRKCEVNRLGPTLGETTEEWPGKEVSLVSVKTSVGAGVRMKPKTSKEAAANG